MKSFLIAKFGQEKHIRALYEKGHVYFNHYSFFQQTASNVLGQHDSAEFATEYFNKGSIQINSSKQKSASTLTTDNGLHSAILTSNPPQYTHLACFTKIAIAENPPPRLEYDSRLWEFGDYCLLIDPQRFLDLCGSTYKLKYSKKIGAPTFGEVTYISGTNPKLNCFSKLKEYEYQQECRICTNIQTLKAYGDFFLGSLCGIAMPPLDQKTIKKLIIRATSHVKEGYIFHLPNSNFV